jgi:hypothetical protein
MQNYVVTPEFKQRVTDILNTKKFTQVFPFMNLINREGFQFAEAELNQLVQFLGEFPYNEVAELFNRLPTIVTQAADENTQDPAAEQPATPKAEEKLEKVEAEVAN